MPGWLVSRFSAVGLLVAVLQQIPGIIWAIHPPTDDPFSRNSGSPLVEVLEKAFEIASLVLIVLVLGHLPVPAALRQLSLVGSLAVLAAYYLLYVMYYRGLTATPVLLGMAVFPPVAFILVAIYQGNWLAVVTSAVFAVVHVGLTYRNFVLGVAAGSMVD